MMSRRPGRPTKYDWSDKHDICYKLFVEEEKPIKDIISYFKQVYGSDASLPNPRDFSRQFNRWHFPPRKQVLTDDEEGRLLHRVRELFDANHGQRDMLDVLSSEGWQLDAAHLARLRRKHGLMLRVAKGFDREHMGPGTGKKRKHVDSPQDLQPEPDATPGTQLDSEEAERRSQRLTALQAQSDAALDSRKRRRRTRGLANLPPDAPGLPPRYKSETSLDECKVFLSLTNESYKDIRHAFEHICHEMDIIKKRLCNDGDWTAAKNRLIKENVLLSAALNPVHGNIAERENALEVICSDVTKRMRGQQTKITVKDANNTLGLTPETSKQLRRLFYDILKADNFETKLLCGKEHWEELTQQWFRSSELAQQLQKATAGDIAKQKCIDVLLRDAMKRHHDNNVAKISHLTQQTPSIGPGPARDVPSVPKSSIHTHNAATKPNLDIDPALYAALSSELARPTTVSIPAYFRLSPESRAEHSKIWLASLMAPTMRALKVAALSKNKSATVERVSGVMKNSAGYDEVYQIDNDEELQAYLEAVNEVVGGKATFLLVLH